MKRRLFALVVPALLLAMGPTGCGYNNIQKYDENVNTAKGNIEAQLQRRADLIPNLVATVKGYAQQESSVLANVAAAQRGLQGALQRPGGASPGELANANDNLTRALTPFFTIVQGYPDLKSNEQFMRLQDELSGTENRIAVARTDYNSAVQQYNTYIRQMPAALTARATGAKPREFFEVTNAASRTAPTVDFSPPAAAPTASGAAPSAPAAPGAPARP